MGAAADCEPAAAITAARVTSVSDTCSRSPASVGRLDGDRELFHRLRGHAHAAVHGDQQVDRVAALRDRRVHDLHAGHVHDHRSDGAAARQRVEVRKGDVHAGLLRGAPRRAGIGSQRNVSASRFLSFIGAWIHTSSELAAPWPITILAGTW